MECINWCDHDYEFQNAVEYAKVTCNYVCSLSWNDVLLNVLGYIVQDNRWVRSFLTVIITSVPCMSNLSI